MILMILRELSYGHLQQERLGRALSMLPHKQAYPPRQGPSQASQQEGSHHYLLQGPLIPMESGEAIPARTEVGQVDLQKGYDISRIVDT